MPDDLYERDILLWSEREADLLRRLSRGELVNGAVDWTHVFEELADVGLSELHAVESLLRHAMLHVLKLALEPDAQAAAHWRSEALGFLGDAQDRCAPSMRQRIDLDKLWRRAVRQAAPGRGVSAACSWTLDALLAEESEIAALAARLAA